MKRINYYSSKPPNYLMYLQDKNELFVNQNLKYYNIIIIISARTGCFYLKLNLNNIYIFTIYNSLRKEEKP
ncbi:MAG: hypothetical protein EOP33_08400 [Rickettsiaceae bacterium]|nr:MAG: hypothetical protein EOP33_08400 [Rickettsiaceae bacterium]